MYLPWSYEKVLLFGETTTRDVVINYIDIPFYALFLFILFKWLWEIYKGNHLYLNNFQSCCTVGCLFYLILMTVNKNCRCIKMDDIFFWGNFIILFTFFVYGYKYLKFKK